MEKSKTKKRRAEKRPLNVTGPLAMPSEILPWERDLLAVILEVVDSNAHREDEPALEVTP